MVYNGRRYINPNIDLREYARLIKTQGPVDTIAPITVDQNPGVRVIANNFTKRVLKAVHTTAWSVTRIMKQDYWFSCDVWDQYVGLCQPAASSSS